MSLEACLPQNLRGPTTTITRVAAGLSGAGVYRVEADGQVFVLKVSGPNEPVEAWRRRVAIQRSAAGAGLAPAMVHVDEAERAVVSAFVADRSLPAMIMDPRTRDAALVQLGQTLRRVHELPLPADAPASDPCGLLAALWAGPLAGFALPSFVGDAVQRMLTEPEPPRDRMPVLSHNDVNPTNLVHDGERILLLDWDTAAPNDPYYDPAAISVFLRMDDATCLRLLSAYDDAPVTVLPARFAYSRRLVAVLCGIAFLHLSRAAGHPGATGSETLDTTASLSEFYQRLRSGSLAISSPDGRWAFGLGLVKESVAR